MSLVNLFDADGVLDLTNISSKLSTDSTTLLDLTKLQNKNKTTIDKNINIYDVENNIDEAKTTVINDYSEMPDQYLSLNTTNHEQQNPLSCEASYEASCEASYEASYEASCEPNNFDELLLTIEINDTLFKANSPESKYFNTPNNTPATTPTVSHFTTPNNTPLNTPIATQFNTPTNTPEVTPTTTPRKHIKKSISINKLDVLKECVEHVENSEEKQSRRAIVNSDVFDTAKSSVMVESVMIPEDSQVVKGCDFNNDLGENQN